MGTLKYFWLGRPVIELDGSEIKMETRKATALLAYLSISTGAVPREQLATMFWPEWSQQKALANLRRILSSLRERLPPGAVDADREKIALGESGKVWVDVDVFGLCLSRVREHEHPSGERCDECLALLKETLGYYRGPFLESFNLGDAPDFDEWQAFQRQEYQERLAWVLEALSGAEAARGEWDQAVAHARQWVMLDRLDEAANRRLIELYERGGQRNAALQQYRELAKLLAEQVGEEPEVETKRLYERIRGDGKGMGNSRNQLMLPLLKTKLYIPTLPEHFVARPLLVKRLEEVKDRTMTIISAPAGFGKTTLLAEWISQTELPVAWLSLDAGDNDPYRFLAYLLAGLESLHEDVGAEFRQLMSSSHMLPPHILLASLINDLGKVSEPYVLVLDDYQFINEHEVHEVLSYLLDHIPSNMHILIATRADPPMQLGRLRANGELLELRSQDLRFTRKEVKEFLSEVVPLDLSLEEVRALEERTEGWVVGLKMAALSLKGVVDPSAFIRAFSGSTRYVLDYLVEEVIKRQPAHVQTFLLTTSILEKLNSHVCESLIRDEGQLEIGKSQEILEYLERNNLFLISLDDERNWFRYHHLFGDLLRMKLKQNHPDKERNLHQKAALWFAEHAYQGEAIDHALAAMDFSLAADCIERSALSLIMRSEIATVSKWINCLPREVVRSRPRLLIYQAWVLARMGDTGDLEKILQDAEAVLGTVSRSPESNEMRDYVTQLRAYIANLKGDADLAIQVALNVGEQPGGTLPPLADIHYLIGFQLGYAYFTKGDLATAETIFRSVARSAERTDDFYNAIIAQVELAGIHALRGELLRAKQVYESTQEWIARQVENPSLLDGILNVCRAGILLERNVLEDADRLVREGIAHARLGSRTNTLVYGYVILAQVLRAQGDLVHAREAVEQANGYLRSHRIYPRTHQSVKICQVEQWLAEGDIPAAQRYMADEFQSPSGQPVLEELENITRARLLLATGEYEKALKLLAALGKAAEAGGRAGRLIKINILRALAFQDLGKSGDAFRALGKALDQAGPEGYMKIFLDEGAKLESLLEHGRQQGLWQEPGMVSYIDRLLTSFGGH